MGNKGDHIMNAVQIARVCHEANRAYCLGLMDYSQHPWELAPQWQRDSAVFGVEFRLGHPDSTSEDIHNSWLAVKEQDGWKYGAVKDAEKKEHPCCVPYAELPEEQKLKDKLFGAIVQALAE